MKLITLHDHMNTSQEVNVDVEQIQVVQPFGSGSTLMMTTSTVAVHESPQEVMRLVREALG